MDVQHLLDVLGGVILILVTAIVKVLWDAVKTLQADMQRIEVALPTQYVAKDEFNRGVSEIKAMLEKISEKLDDKADKR
jgi:predicted Holliday junction resolvase-like endonuclease